MLFCFLFIFFFFVVASISRLEDLSLKQKQDKADKVATWEIWIIRIRELQDQCQAKTKALKSAGEPQNKKDVEEQIIQAKVSSVNSGKIGLEWLYDWLNGCSCLRNG